MITFKQMSGENKVLCYVFFNIFRDGKEIGRLCFDLRTKKHSFCFPTTLQDDEEVNAAARELAKTLDYEYRPEVKKHYTGGGTIIGYKDLVWGCKSKTYKIAKILIGDVVLEYCLFSNMRRNERIEKPVGSKIGVHHSDCYYFNDIILPYREHETTYHYWVKNDTIDITRQDDLLRHRRDDLRSLRKHDWHPFGPRSIAARCAREV